MAEQPEIADSGSVQVNPEPAEDMEVESISTEEGGDGEKQERVEEKEGEEENCSVSKKRKGGKEEEKSVEEERLEKEKQENGSGRVRLGPKEFVSSVEMFDYFYKFLHFWPTDLEVNKYEYLVLLDLIKKGHAEPERKIGGGIKAFEIRNHPMWKSRCFFLVRDDDTADDFSFRKCVDQILPLPENMKAPKSGGGGGGGGGSGRGRGRGHRGRGRGGKFRN